MCSTNSFGNKLFANIWAASSEFGTYRLCEQWWFRRACVSAQSRQNLRCSLIQAVNQEEPSDRKPDPWPLWMAGHAQLKFVMTECSKTQIHLTGLIYLKGMSIMCETFWNNCCRDCCHPRCHSMLSRLVVGAHKTHNNCTITGHVQDN